MIKINYNKPDPNETLDEIAMYNIIQSDKNKKLDYLEMSCISWLKIDAKRDYQDLEQLFRYLDISSYIIAKPIENIPENVEINYPNNNIPIEPLEYIAKIICKSKEDSIKELELYHISYEENFDCLKKTGCLMNKKILNLNNNLNLDNLDNLKKLDNLEKITNSEDLKKVLNAETKLEFCYYKAKDSINYLIEDLIKKCGKKPTEIVCGEIGNKKVHALVVENEIVSPIGWIKNKNNNDNNDNDDNDDYELIDFRIIKAEK